MKPLTLCICLYSALFLFGAILGCNTEQPVVPPDEVDEGGTVPPPPPPAGMVLIPAGEFDMGSNGGENDELLVRKVYVDAFYIV